jgi:hypothetical protein
LGGGLGSGSLGNPGWPHDLLASASQVLGLQLCATTPANTHPLIGGFKFLNMALNHLMFLFFELPIQVVCLCFYSVLYFSLRLCMGSLDNENSNPWSVLTEKNIVPLLSFNFCL